MAQAAALNRYFVNQFIKSFIKEEIIWGNHTPKTRIIWVDELPSAQNAGWLPEPAGYTGYRCMSAMVGRQINILNQWMAEQVGQLFAGAAGYITYRDILYVKRSIWVEYDPSTLTGPSEHTLRKEEVFFKVTEVTYEEFRRELRTFIKEFYPNWVEYEFNRYACRPRDLQGNECQVSFYLVQVAGDWRKIPVFKYWRDEPEGSSRDRVTPKWVSPSPYSGSAERSLREAIWPFFEK